MSKNNRLGSKAAPILIDGDQPAVKKEAEEEADSPLVAELKKKMEKIERLAQGAIEQAGIYRARVLLLESLIDQKSELIKEKQANDEDLEKQMDELKEELADAKTHIAKLVSQTHEIEGQGKNVTLQKNVLKEQKTIEILEKKNEELEKKVNDLTKEKEEDRREKEEDRRRLMEMEKKMREMAESVLINAAPIEGNEERRVMREDEGEEPMEMGGHMEDDYDLRDEGEVKNRRRSSRNASKSVKYAESMEESDEETGPAEKKRSESVEEKDKKGRSSSKGDSQSNSVKKNKEESMGTVKKELECPECEYRSISVNAWVLHLREKHSTTPTLAGCLIHCDCGHESYSDGHRRKCAIANFTIIRTGDGVIRRLTDKPVTPKCVMCEIHPKTIRGFAAHLPIHHETTLLANGIYLKCACGYRCTADTLANHDKKCTGRDFTLHKLDED